MLTVSSITAGYYEDIDILNDVSLKVDKGKVVGIIGPNGAGKSTLLKTIFGYLKPRKGKIIFMDKDITGFKPYELKRMGISYVPQDFSVFPQLTVEENLKLGAWIFKDEKDKIYEKLDAIYQQFPNLAKKRNKKAVWLSGGELRMLEIAKAAMTDPKLMLIDEPSAGLAPKFVEEVYERIKQHSFEGISILLVDQNIVKAVEISEYLYMIEIGRVKVEGPKEFFEKNLEEIIKSSLVGK
ncbi:MAG: ABC transporter ATP-binding protein [Nitrososphaerales archaeon]